MLNSIVAMRAKAILSYFLCLTSFVGLIAANQFQVTLEATIESPLPGEAVQGLVQIKGNTLIEGFSAYELAFSFKSNSTETWFLIKQSQSPVGDAVLGEWDTSVLSDGNYVLRLIVYRAEASPIVILIEGIRVRNYSPIETETPADSTITIEPTLIDITPESQAPTKTPLPLLSPTALSKNPAEINPQDISSSIQRGAIIVAILLGILGLHTFFRSRQ
jgi:hypothetical protein